MIYETAKSEMENTGFLSELHQNVWLFVFKAILFQVLAPNSFLALFAIKFFYNYLIKKQQCCWCYNAFSWVDSLLSLFQNFSVLL